MRDDEHDTRPAQPDVSRYMREEREGGPAFTIALIVITTAGIIGTWLELLTLGS